MAEIDPYMLGDDESLFTPIGTDPMVGQRVLASKVRKTPAIAMPTSGVPRVVPAASAAQAPGAPPAAPGGKQFGTADDILAQMAAKLGQQPDSGPFVQAAQERHDTSNRKLMLALALGAQGGEAFKPFSGMLAQDALKHGGDYDIPGGWGSVSPEGTVTWNTAKQQEAELARLQALYGIKEKSETSRLTAQMHNENLAAQREATAAQRAATQSTAQQGQQMRADQNRFHIEDQSRNHFDQVTKDTRDVLNMSRAMATKTGKLTPVDQQNLIVLLNKFIDPGSVVREGEFNRVAEAQGILQRWGNLPAKLATGQPLPPALEADIKRAVGLYTTAAENTMRDTAKAYIENARRRGLDANAIVTDPRWHPAASGEEMRPGGRGTAGSPIKVNPARGGGGAPEQVIKVDY